MSNINLSVVATFGPPKEAALFFDRILPVDLGEVVSFKSLDSGLYIPREGIVFDEKVVKSLLRSESAVQDYIDLTNKGVILRMVSSMVHSNDIRDREVSAGIFAFFAKYDFNYDGIRKSIRDATFDLDDFQTSISLDVYRRSLELGFGEAPIWNTSPYAGAAPDDVGEEPKFVASLKSASSIDIMKVDWETITAFREDKASMKALRDFRLAFHQSYATKELSQIQDEMGVLLDKYEHTRKSWGLSVAESVFDAVFSKQAAGGTLAGLALTPYSPVAGALAGGLSIASGVTLSVFRERHKSKQIELDSPIRYVSKLKALTSKQN